MKEGGS